MAKNLTAEKKLEKRKQFRAALMKALSFMLSTLGLLSLVIIYSVIGGFVFSWLEATNEELTKKAGRNKIRALTDEKAKQIYRTIEERAKFGLTSSDRNGTLLVVERELSEYYLAAWELARDGDWDGTWEGDGDIELSWSFTGALLFSVTTICAIGYGVIAPVTRPGRITCIFYSVFGLPIALIFITNIGFWFAQQVRTMHMKVSARCRKSTTTQVQEVPVLFSLLTMVAYVFLGTAIFCTWENWEPVDGAYFSFITLTTVGFGDIVPDVYKGGSSWDHTNKTIELIICGFYLFIGLALLAMCMDLMKEEVRANFLWLGQKIGLGASRKKKEAK